MPDKEEDSALETAFWEELGITPIIIDDSTPESFETGLQQVFQAIEDAATEIKELENNG